MSDSQRPDVPSRKKFFYPIIDPLRDYLKQYDREIDLPVRYSDLLRFNFHTPLLNKDGSDTLWQTVYYSEGEMKELFPALTYIYALMHIDGDKRSLQQLTVARIDFCSFGNSQPFRIRIINSLNDNYDHFYIKRADASRIYGLELEHTLSPNRIIYISSGDTLAEGHIPGLPGDVFINHRLGTSKFNQIRICKEFVKFNERCFLRLLGDMRSYNFVVDITPDIEGNQYRIRAIDFDQQSYEGRRKFYLPHFFKENNALNNLGMKYITEDTMRQYQEEERSLIAQRVRIARFRLHDLMKVMRIDKISPDEKVKQLAADLGEYHKTDAFDNCNTMGQILTEHMHIILTRTKL